MTPSSLLNVPSELLRQRAGEHSVAAPMGALRDRLWAGLVFGAFIGLSIALISALQ